MVVGPSQVIESFGAGLQVAAPPLVGSGSVNLYDGLAVRRKTIPSASGAEFGRAVRQLIHALPRIAPSWSPRPGRRRFQDDGRSDR